MSNENIELASWDDLEGVELEETQTIELPTVSKALGKPFRVKVRALDAKELLVCANFPLGEINDIAEAGGDAEAYQKAYQEHVRSFDADDLWRMLRAVVVSGLVDKVGDEKIEQIKKDWPVIYKAVLEMTMPKEDAEAAGEFRQDG